MTPIRLSPQVGRKMAVERAIELMGRRYLLHPANRVQKLAKPLDAWNKRSKQ